MNLPLDLKKRETFSKAFALLKLVCDKIALNPSEDHSKQLSFVLDGLNRNDIQMFQHYILFPLEVHLINKKTNKDETLCKLLASLNVVLARTCIDEITIFLRLYSVIFLQIDNQENPGKIPKVSEELKYGVVQCTKQLFLRTNRGVLENFYDREYYPKLSLGIYMCCQLAKTEKFLTLRTEALLCILIMMQVHDGVKKNTNFHNKVANVIMLMVPGIMSACVSITSGPDTQNHKIIVLALQVWSRLIGLVMEDVETEGKLLCTVFKLGSGENIIPESLGIPKKGAKNLYELKQEVENQKRCESWLRATGKQLFPLTKVIVKLTLHSHSNVRREMAISAGHILTSAPISMSLSVSLLIDSLVILCQDQDDSVAKVSQRAVDNFSKNCTDSMGKSLLEIVEESLYSLITRLPRILNGTDEVAIEEDLTLLCGYLKILGKSNLPRVLSSSQHLNRLITALKLASVFDASDITLLEEISLRSVEEKVPVLESGWKKFKLCHYSKLQSKLEEVCSIIRDSSDLMNLTQFLLDLFHSDVYYRKEYIFLINQIFSSGSTNSLVPHIDTAKTVLVSYMDPAVWYAPFTVGKDGADSKQTAQHNVVQVCLLAEGVSKLASGLGPEKFSPLLLRCLYQLLECAGSPIYMVACAGLKSVTEIANLYGGEVSQLVSQNVDYLSHHITLRLQNMQRNPRVLSVLSVIMKHSSIQVLPSLHEIISDVLVQSCDNFQGINANGFLYVFYTFVTCLQSWIGCEKLESLLDKEIPVKNSVVEEVLDYHKSNIEANSFLEGDENESRTKLDLCYEDLKRAGVEPEPEEDEEKCPDYVMLTVDILNRSLHFLPSPDIPRQILILQILAGGIMILTKWRDQLLPIVHKVWSPLVERFRPNNHALLLQRAFCLLTVLAYCSQDFIKQRTLKYVIPSLCDILKHSAVESKLKDVGHAYRMSQSYKLQLTLLNGLGPLAVHMEFREKDLNLLLTSTLPYLNSLQPVPLQDACMNMYKTIASVNSDIVWVHLMSLCPPQDALLPPLPFLNKIKLVGLLPAESAHYKTNIEELFTSL